MNLNDPNLELVGDVARALVALDAVKDLAAFHLPYPAEAQRALDRLVLRTLRDRAAPPASVPGMVTFCQERPVVDWPLTLPSGLFAPGSRFVDEEYGYLTELCFEAATALGTAFPRESPVDTMLDDLAKRCQARQDAAAYSTFRRMLAESPVLDNEAVSTINFELPLGLLDDVIWNVYRKADERWADRGLYRACGGCSHLAIPLGADEWCCESDKCGEDVVESGGSWTDDEGPLHHLDRWHRQFVSRQAQAVLRLAGRLEAVGAKAEPWPRFGTYDLQILLSHGRTWGIRMVDWGNAALAGVTERPIDEPSTVDRVYRVVPGERLLADPGYLSTFRAFGPADGVEVVTDEEVLRTTEAALVPGGAGA
ncbi:HU-CCDC81 and SPOR domain-containing protein [Nocardia sp. NRRL S-836]|uniref:pPIWI_RE_Y domain-containing protein n=1 Tax=Nocardia sp. NRRL S-836 TaxID=1519492 RepID=UPI0006AF511C|nr:HU-CCDC81 and SPOR domain-containing protein [Nocardia sp. NRRL S-836]KOV76889.1 hypothetical protein ADL03_42330 [Nocardia sp. NRRL S-836]